MPNRFALCAVAGSLLLGASTLSAGENKPPTATNVPGSDPEKQSEYRLKWNLETLVGDYERHGRRNPKWDESAKASLTSLAETRSLSGSTNAMAALAKIPGAVKTAVSNGCDDPMIHYLHLRFVLWSENQTPKERAETYALVAEALLTSQYAPIRKFYAAWRAAETYNPGGTNMSAEVHRWRRLANRYLNEAVSDKSMPPAEVYEACDSLLEAVKNNQRQYEEFYQALEPTLFRNWPADSALYLLKGRFYTHDAWLARGRGFADKVTEEGWRVFADRLAEAEQALGKAWELNPRDERIACEMMTVELGQGKGRPRMEMWFKRATELNPNYYEAFSSKLYYLEPKWHGSAEDMIAFGRECVNSKKWGGHVPLVLRDAHESLVKYVDKAQQADYWKRPAVWKDIKAAFDKFFELNPTETRWRHNYALYAYRAGQWDELNRQLPLLGEINFDFFGGREKYGQMVQLAKEHARK